MPAVFEFLPNTSADLDAMIQCYGQVPLIEQIVEIGTKQYAVIGKMWSEHAVRLDVRCFQCRKRFLPGYCAPSLVRVSHRDTKRALAQPWIDKVRLSVSFGGKFLPDGPLAFKRAALKSFSNLSPKI